GVLLADRHQGVVADREFFRLQRMFLEADHFGLDKVKERIVEYLAVQARATKIKGTILCLVGPQGVGKTSLAQSIAKATGREYVR
ncbi:AAA family ATPase, partial [Rhizobium leguminosarum]|uniref:AAA family ATPase n=1 Tax=Rhizobium leguminosarum TaxID=384 RepID=UPI003F966E08